jgi:hypothetical protein
VMGLTLLQGRFLSEQEVNAGRHMIVVNETLVKRYFQGESAIGRQIRIPRLKRPPLNLTDDSLQIVGVVRDTVNRVTTNETWPQIFMPYTIVSRADRVFALGSGRPELLAAALKSQIYAVDPSQPVMDVKSMETLLAENAYARPRFNLLLFAIFAVLGLVLALLGIYGVISHSVSQQTREIGIRIALGASFWQVMRLVLGMGTRLRSVLFRGGGAAALFGRDGGEFLARPSCGRGRPDRRSARRVRTRSVQTSLEAWLAAGYRPRTPAPGFRRP